MSKGAPGVRYAEVDRDTAETKIHMVLDLDGGTRCDVDTGIGFFDHMLHQLSFHGLCDLGISVEGDLSVDDHHSVEDVGITLGMAIREALAESSDITRYASLHLPMDEALVLVALDISGRGVLRYDVDFKRERIGELATENVREFFHAVAVNAGLTLHIKKIDGENDHHVCEAIFKGFGQVLHRATRTMDRKKPASTKGKLG
jgi:imidazoleglycerol-phosphate dehydratase